MDASAISISVVRVGAPRAAPLSKSTGVREDSPAGIHIDLQYPRADRIITKARVG